MTATAVLKRQHQRGEKVYFETRFESVEDEIPSRCRLPHVGVAGSFPSFSEALEYSKREKVKKASCTVTYAKGPHHGLASLILGTPWLGVSHLGHTVAWRLSSWAHRGLASLILGTPWLEMSCT
ncbi:hypothetical protein AVEN_29848-1 [Araneus ventricosus]|uniref:Uncharacterized protein n=1 Tax=Araneus ventricosus TaxID=182803 RepID=A0A4Y2UM80_ARAVE|nr:hypothetical protein AVEN_29848-1 [Araneus ventricosus]